MKSKKVYTCPMHPEIVQSTPGLCPKCGMGLVIRGAPPQKRSIKDFTPLIAIFGLIVSFTIIRQALLGSSNVVYAMNDFMAGFFIIFGAFKLLNWKGFVDAYKTYDVIAKRIALYAYLYPLIELGLGMFYLLRLFPIQTNIVTLIIMVIGGIGVVTELKKKNQIMCACLGVVFKLPMTWVTFAEDAVMAVMAGAMLLILL